MPSFSFLVAQKMYLTVSVRNKLRLSYMYSDFCLIFSTYKKQSSCIAAWGTYLLLSRKNVLLMLVKMTAKLWFNNFYLALNLVILCTIVNWSLFYCTRDGQLFSSAGHLNLFLFLNGTIWDEFPFQTQKIFPLIPFLSLSKFSVSVAY